MYPDEYKVVVLPDTGPASEGLVYKFACELDVQVWEVHFSQVCTNFTSEVYKLYCVAD